MKSIKNHFLSTSHAEVKFSVKPLRQNVRLYEIDKSINL